MVECKVAGMEWTNQEGYIRITNTPTKEHPWYGKIVCCDWDAFCTKCMEDENIWINWLQFLRLYNE